MENLELSAEEIKKAKKREYSKRYNIKNKDKRQQYRKENAEKRNEYNKKYYLDNPDKRRNHKLKHRYNISLDEYNIMFNNQNGCCWICNIHQNELDKPLYVDHCHDTNKIRGLLCHKCNCFIGYADDNIEKLKRAIEYLTKQ